MKQLILILLSLIVFVPFSFTQVAKQKEELEKALNLETPSEQISELFNLAYNYRIAKPEINKLLLSTADSIAEHNKLNYSRNIIKVLSFKYDILANDTAIFQQKKQDIKSFIEVNDNPVLWGEYYMGIGYYYQSMGEFNKQIVENSKSIEYFLKANDTLNLARAYNSIAMSFIWLGNSEFAMDYLLEGMEYVIPEKDNTILYRYLNNMGVVYERLFDYDKALDSYFSALRLAKNSDITSTLIILYNNIADIYLKLDRFSEAKSYLDKAYNEAINMQSEIDIVFQSHSYGGYYLEVNQLDSAQHYFNISIPGFIKLNDRYSLGTGYFDMALLKVKEQKLSQSIYYFNKAAEVFLSIRNLNEYQQTIKNISESYADLGNYKKAKEYADLAYHYTDTIIQEKSKDYLKYLNARLDFEKDIDVIKQELYNTNREAELEIERQKRTRNAYMFSAIILLLIIVFTYILFRKSEKLNIELSKKNKDIRQKSALVEIAHSELVEQYSFTETLLNTIPNPVFYTDKNRYILGCNKAFEEIAGLKEDKLIDINLSELNIKTELACDFSSIFGHPEMDYQRREGMLQFADKKYHDVICFQKSIWRNDSKVIGSLGIIVDISDVKKAEKKIKQSEAQLRTALDAKDKFFRIVAHDLKNPFGVVLGLTETLLNNYKKHKSEDVEKYLQTINDSSNQIYSLLENLLEWARTQTNSFVVNKTTFAINDPIERSLSLFKEQIEQKQIQVTLSKQPDLLIEADKNMIQTVFRNMVSNAIKFTPDMGSLDIKIEQLDKEIQVAIKDTGIGISPDNLEKLFQVDKTISTQGLNNEKGTGLGLVICQEFIRKHGGKIEVQSKVNSGTTFKFVLPTALN